MTVGDLNVDDLIQELQQRIPPESSPVGLLFNPFPVTGIAGVSDGRILAPVDPLVIRQVREFLLTALQSDQFIGMVVVGDFGLGKTHLLRWIERIINGTSAKLPNQVTQAYYIGNPGIRPMEILMAVIRAVGEEEFRKMLWAVVASDLRTTYRSGGTSSLLSVFGASPDSLLTPSEETLNALVRDDSLASLSIFRERYRGALLPPRGLRSHVTSVLSRISPNLDVVRALTNMLIDDEMAAFTSWISVSSAEASKPLRVPQQDYFNAILRVLKANGYGRIFLLIDEFEDVVGIRLTARQRAEYLATLRLLIDKHVDDFSLVVAMVPAAWDETKKIHPTFADRVGGPGRPVDLLPLDPTRAEELARRYMREARSPGNNQPGDELAPFTPSAIAAILEASGGNTRAFVSGCYRVLQHCWKEREIDGASARAVLGA